MAQSLDLTRFDLERGLHSAFCVEGLLDLLPNSITGLFVDGQEEGAGLLCDVLKVANKSRTVLAGIEVLMEGSPIGDSMVSRGK